MPIQSLRSRNAKTIIRKLFLAPKIPSKIEKNFVRIDAEKLNSISKSLEANYFSHEAPDYLTTSEGERDLEAHLTGRLDWDRENIIPWLDQAKSLSGASILEIGCGTGASTVALAEQGAKIVAVDIDEPALKDAAFRCHQYDVSADFHCTNATKLLELFPAQQFDMIIFYASLEHMTYEERTKSIKCAWELLPAGGHFCVVDTPNRLAPFDEHTSQLPFFNWLPDEIAMQYSKFSPRETFSEAFKNFDEQLYVKFMRWGRGMSYHEFQLALTDVNLGSASCLSSFQRKQRLLGWLKWRLSQSYKFQRVLRSMAPNVHSAFFEPALNLIITKPN